MATTVPVESLAQIYLCVCCYGNNLIESCQVFSQSLNTLDHENACSSSISEKSVIVCMHNLHYSVYHNSLTSTGAIALARALQQNKTLKELK